ncbi:MAG: hypothetical protein M3P30_12660 [Chloroflexota bacterium]|nr:hypothetical protein [Chloroflexota bacterium]
MTDQGDCQPFPQTGPLAANTNCERKTLWKILQGQDGIVYCYIVDTIEYRGQVFCQTGTGPNFQGDLITLCTCKHYMRSGREIADWRGQWVAGFSGKHKVEGDPLHYLVYLMKVADAYASHQDLWAQLSSEARHGKAAHLNRLGDVYQPRAKVGDPFDYRSYQEPGPNHSHCNGDWHKDIDDVGYGGRRPPLLVGDPQFSFLWNKPMIALPLPPDRQGCKKHKFGELLRQLDRAQDESGTPQSRNR